jgi:hypothetical protein
MSRCSDRKSSPFPTRVWLSIVIAMSLALGITATATASGRHILLPPHYPSSNYNVPDGTLTTLSWINRARAGQEGLGPLRLNMKKYDELSVVDQLFVLSNLERITRGESPAYALMKNLDTYAASGARLQRDPLPPRNWIGSFSSNWSGGYGPRNTLALGADLGWMYDDGPPPFHNGYNLDCPRAGSEGCWGHRSNILQLSPDAGFTFANPVPFFVLLMGAGYANPRGSMPSLTEDFSWVVGYPRTGVAYTWAHAVIFLGLPKSDIPSTTTTTTIPTTTTLPTTTTSTTTTTTSPPGD